MRGAGRRQAARQQPSVANSDQFLCGWEQGESSQAEAVIADIRLFTPSTPPAAPPRSRAVSEPSRIFIVPGEGHLLARQHIDYNLWPCQIATRLRSMSLCPNSTPPY